MSKDDKIVEQCCDFLMELIKCKTISQRFDECKEEFEKCKDLIVSELENLGFECKIINNNIIADFDLGKSRTLGFICHYDVVPANEEKWKTDPFSPVMKEGKILGRGASDDKGGIASFICGIKKMLELGKDPEKCLRGNIKFVCTFDEEVGSKNGMLYLLKNFKKEIIADSYYILDVGMDESITMGCSGIISGKLTAKARKIKEDYPFVQHSAYPFFITNPAHEIIEIGQKIIKEFVPNEEKMISRYPCEKNPLKKEKIWNRFSITMLNCGEKDNIIPDKAEMVFNWRLIPEDDTSKAKSRLLDFLRRIGKINNVDVKFFLEENGYCCENSEDLKILSEVTGLNASVSMGFIDGAHIWKHLNVPAFGYGPCKKNANIHGCDEFIEIKTIDALGDIICDYLTYPLS